MSTRRGFFGRMVGLLAAGVPVAVSAAPEFQMPVTPAAITAGAFDDAQEFLRQFEYNLYTPPPVDIALFGSRCLCPKEAEYRGFSAQVEAQRAKAQVQSEISRHLLSAYEALTRAVEVKANQNARLFEARVRSTKSLP